MRPAVRYDFGQPGSEIPESLYYRGYCRTCGEPIRVIDPNHCLDQDCTDCRRLVQREPGRQSVRQEDACGS
jgi:hypothetical protein